MNGFFDTDLHFVSWLLTVWWLCESKGQKCWRHDHMMIFNSSSACQNYGRAMSVCLDCQHWTETINELWLSCDWHVRTPWGNISTWVGLFTLKLLSSIYQCLITGERFLLNCCNSTRPCKLLQHNIAVIKKKYTADQSAKHLCPNYHHGGRNPHLPLASFGSLAPRLSPFLWPVMTRKQTDVVLRGKCAQWIFCGRGFIPVFANLG